MMDELTWLAALIAAGIAGYTDWRDRRIPNWLTVSSLLAGVGINSLLQGLAGLRVSLAGMALGLGLLLPLVLLRGLGAGDWKLMGALGAILGSSQLIVVLLGTIFLLGFMALIQITLAGRWRETLTNMWGILLMLGSFGAHPRPDLTIENPRLLKLPFGTAAGIITTAIYAVRTVRSA